MIAIRSGTDMADNKHYARLIGEPCKHMRPPMGCQSCEIEKLRAALPDPAIMELMADNMNEKSATAWSWAIEAQLRDWARRIREVINE